MQRRFNIALMLLFVASLLIPGMVQLQESGRSVSDSEKRELAPFPAITWNAEGIAAFPAGVEAWFRDHIGLRGQAIKIYNYAHVLIFGSTPLPDKVALGNTGKWLFMVDTPNLSTYLQEIPFAPATLDKIEQNAISEHTYCAERGITYAWLLLPRKENVYPEYLPRWMVKRGPAGRMDEVMQRMAKHPEVMVLDGRPILHIAKGAYPLYFETDTHWNALGACAVYPWLIQKLRSRDPSLPIMDLDRVKVSETREPGLDLAEMLDMRRYYAGVNHRLDIGNLKSKPSKYDLTKYSDAWEGSWAVLYEQDMPDGPTAIIFSDSFGPGIYAFFTECFRRVICVRSWYFSEQIIAAEKPQLVLRINVEATFYSELAQH